MCVKTIRMLANYVGTSGDLVRHHNDDRRFHPTSTDIEIITSLHQEDPEWVFVGGDGKILKYKAKIAVLAERDLTYLMLNHN